MYFKEDNNIKTKDIIKKLRTKKGLSQEELAKKISVPSNTVSSWEKGDTVPNTEMLRQLSRFFNVSINTLLGSPKELICQCCGMPLDDSCTSKEKDGSFNEEYCKWCYADGKYTYDNIDELIDVYVKDMANDDFTKEASREYLEITLPDLKNWKNHAKKRKQ